MSAHYTQKIRLTMFTIQTIRQISIQTNNKLTPTLEALHKSGATCGLAAHIWKKEETLMLYWLYIWLEHNLNTVLNRAHTNNQQLSIFKGIFQLCMSICLWDQFIMSYLMSTGNQPIIKKINYTTNQGTHSKLKPVLRKTFNVSLCKHLTKLIYYTTHPSIFKLHMYCLQVITHECHVYNLQFSFILVWSFTCNVTYKFSEISSHCWLIK